MFERSHCIRSLYVSKSEPEIGGPFWQVLAMNNRMVYRIERRTHQVSDGRVMDSSLRVFDYLKTKRCA